MTPARATELTKAILADGTVDPQEWDLLDELSGERTRSISVTRANPGGAEAPAQLSVASTLGETRQILIKAIPVADLEKAWADAASGWPTFVTEYQRGGVTGLRTSYFLSDKLMLEWRQSNTANAYAPLINKVSVLYKACDSLGDHRDAGRALLREALKLVDDYDDGKLPDFLYTWITPGSDMPAAK